MGEAGFAGLVTLVDLSEGAHGGNRVSPMKAASVGRLVPRLELLAQVTQKAASEGAVDEPVVVRERQVHDRTDRDHVGAAVVLDHPRPLDDRVCPQDRRLGLADHRRAVEGAVPAWIRDRERPALDVVGEQLLLARATRDVGHASCDSEQVQPFRMLEHRHDQPFAVGERDGEAKIRQAEDAVRKGRVAEAVGVGNAPCTHERAPRPRPVPQCLAFLRRLCLLCLLCFLRGAGAWTGRLAAPGSWLGIELGGTLTGAAPATVNLWALIALYISAELGRLSLSFADIWTGTTFRYTVGALLRRNLFASILRRPGAKTLPVSSGDAVNRFDDDVAETADFPTWLPDQAGQGIAFVLAVIIMASINLLITLVVFLPLLGTLVLSRLAWGRIHRYYHSGREATGAVSSFLGELFGAVQAVKVANAEEDVIDHFRTLNDARRHANVSIRVFRENRTFVPEAKELFYQV